MIATSDTRCARPSETVLHGFGRVMLRRGRADGRGRRVSSSSRWLLDSFDAEHGEVVVEIRGLQMLLHGGDEPIKHGFQIDAAERARSLLDAWDAEKLASAIARFDDTVGEQDQAISGRKPAGAGLIAGIGADAEWQTS